MINFLGWRALIQCLKQHLKMDWILFRILRTLKKTLPPQQVRVLMFLSGKADDPFPPLSLISPQACLQHQLRAGGQAPPPPQPQTLRRGGNL
ncbi:hypothetical protein HHUSO_G37050 [Huso huso]|uniref:Uncharacterized protein n=1 Tax=Huso huso TaxID=61971 RepID=A0ABR0Y0A6_HUSHU